MKEKLTYEKIINDLQKNVTENDFVYRITIYIIIAFFIIELIFSADYLFHPSEYNIFDIMSFFIPFSIMAAYFIISIIKSNKNNKKIGKKLEIEDLIIEEDLITEKENYVNENNGSLTTIYYIKTENSSNRIHINKNLYGNLDINQLVYIVKVRGINYKDYSNVDILVYSEREYELDKQITNFISYQKK